MTSRFAYLKALDIDVWQRRAPVESRDHDEHHSQTSASIEPAAARAAVIELRGPAESPPAQGGEIAALGWDELAARVRGCTLCPLHATRAQSVFGVGNRQADWMVIGEAPGAEEARGVG